MQYLNDILISLGNNSTLEKGLKLTTNIVLTLAGTAGLLEAAYDLNNKPDSLYAGILGTAFLLKGGSYLIANYANSLRKK